MRIAHWGRMAVVVCVLCLYATPALAMKHLKGQEAKNYVGDVKQKFTDGNYTYEILIRSHRDSMNGRVSDGVIFNGDGARFWYRKREDGKHKIALNHPTKGRLEDPVTAEPLVWNPIANILHDDHPSPHVFLQDDGKEIAIVFIGKKTRIKGSIEPDGSFLIQLTVRGNRQKKRGVGGARI